MSQRNFFAELKRRNVYKVAVAYVVVSWLLIQAASGDRERALDELEMAYQRSDTNYRFILKVDPLFDGLRGVPRFEALVQKITDGK
jgi:hypothetical protein